MINKAVFSLLFCFLYSIVLYAQQSYSVPLLGNAFEIGYRSGKSTIGSKAVVVSSRLQNATRVYFKVLGAGQLHIEIQGRSSVKGKVKATFMESSKVLAFSNTMTTLSLGQFDIRSPGYYYIDLLGVEGETEIPDIVLSGKAVEAGLVYSKDPENYYWSRRGPSCHLGYSIPTASNVSYYYNEVVVPVGDDVLGSYYMANGFGQGYFGMQVNSSQERRILFSVWSPFETDNPSTIPDEEKIVLLKKGKKVKTGEFGSEGSGGQSYLIYNWKAGETYKFLVKGEPDGKGNTDFTAWFLTPEDEEWQLIASFRRPKTNTYLTGFYSFLENFYPTEGYRTRKVEFNNQWVYDGVWKKVKRAKFTVDATYRSKQRIDATGGTTDQGYFLQMGGFFNEGEKPGTFFEYNNVRKEPEIIFSKLP